MSKSLVIAGMLALSIPLVGCGKPAAAPGSSGRAVPPARYGSPSGSTGSSHGSGSLPARGDLLRSPLQDGYRKAKRLDDAARRQVQRSIDARNRDRARRAKLKVYPTVTPRRRARIR